MKKALFMIVPVILLAGLVGFMLANRDTVRTYYYNFTGPDEIIKMSDEPLTYKTKRLDCHERFKAFMEDNGYTYLPDEQMGAMWIFEDQNGVRYSVMTGIESYYMTYRFSDKQPSDLIA